MKNIQSIGCVIMVALKWKERLVAFAFEAKTECLSGKYSIPYVTIQRTKVLKTKSC